VKKNGSELQKLDQLFSKESIIPNDFTQETEEEYFTLLKSLDIGKALTNLSEYLLETEGLKGQAKVSPNSPVIN